MPDQPAVEHPLADQHILIVEDDQVMAEIVAATVRRAGATTAVAGTAMDALDAVEAHDPTVILLDLNLPDISGLDLLEAFRSHSEVPVMVLTGSSDPSFRRRAVEQGASSFLLKPVSSRVLVGRIRYVVDTPYDQIRESLLAELNITNATSSSTTHSSHEATPHATHPDDAQHDQTPDPTPTPTEPMSYGRFIDGLDDVLGDADAFLRQFIQRGGQ